MKSEPTKHTKNISIQTKKIKKKHKNTQNKNKTHKHTKQKQNTQKNTKTHLPTHIHRLQASDTPPCPLSGCCVA